MTSGRQDLFTLLYNIRTVNYAKTEKYFLHNEPFLSTAKVLKKVDISVVQQHFLRSHKDLTVVSTLYLPDYQRLAKKLQNTPKNLT